MKKEHRVLLGMKQHYYHEMLCLARTIKVLNKCKSDFEDKQYIEKLDNRILEVEKDLDSARVLFNKYDKSIVRLLEKGELSQKKLDQWIKENGKF